MLSAVTLVSAQSKNAGTVLPATLQPLEFSSDRALDTLAPSSHSDACFTGDASPLTVYGGPGLGYVTGTNSYGDTQKGQAYTLASGSTVTGVIVGCLTTNASNPNVNAKVYSMSTGSPAASPSGTSANLGLATFMAQGYATFAFTPGVAISGDVLFSVSIPTGSGDTLAVFSTKDNCADAADLSWEEWDNSGSLTWDKLADNWQIAAGNPLNVDLAIYPIVDGPVGVAAVSKNGLTLMNAFPNPTNNLVNFGFSLEESSDVTIEIMDVTGKVIATIELGGRSAGANRFIYDASALTAGNYFYAIKTNDAKLVSRFTVAH